MLIQVSISVWASFSIMAKKKKLKLKQNEVKSSQKPKSIQELEKQNEIIYNKIWNTGSPFVIPKSIWVSQITMLKHVYSRGALIMLNNFIFGPFSKQFFENEQKCDFVDFRTFSLLVTKHFLVKFDPRRTA